MSTTTVTTALNRIARLTPVRARGASYLTGDYAAVCTPAVIVPEAHGLRQAQQERTAWYLSHHEAPTYGRVPNDAEGPGGDALAARAPRYVVTSYGAPIAWVTLDGRTHYGTPASDVARVINQYGSAAWRAAVRHREAISEAWPERFQLDEMGDPVSNECGQLLRHDGLPAYRNHLPARV
jgi:hypothetical protein